MKGETLDRRIRKTRRVIRQCLTELLKTKRIQDITVREISGNEELLAKASIFSALELYLDFINIFLYLLRLFARNRD